MGAYRSKPVTDKVSSDESGKYVKYGASSMQGWRVTQEDAHNCILKYDENSSLFAVYDGHGGHEVAQYCSENLPQYLKECASYKNEDYVKALKEAFLGFDATLTEPKVVKVLQKIVKSADDEVEESENQNSGSEDEENIRNLYEEAQMPLEEVMAKYADGGNPALKKIKDGTPPSPYLVAKQSSKLKFSEEAGSSKAAGGGSSSSSSSSSGSSAEHLEESSNESAEKEGEKSKNGVAEESKRSGSKEQEQEVGKSEESNDRKASDESQSSNGDTVLKEKEDSTGDDVVEKSGDSEKVPHKNKDCNKEDAPVIKKEMERENDVKKESSSGRTLKQKKDEKPSQNNLQEGKSAIKKEAKNEERSKEINSPVKKVEVNGDVDPEDLKQENKKEPHENGDVAEEETDEDEKEENKSRKGKGKAIVKKSERPKRTSARQRDMANLFRSFLAAQDSADSESDDDGDESFQGAEERSSSEDEEKEVEAEGEEEEEDGEEEEEDDAEEEEDDDDDDDDDDEYEDEADDLSKLAKGPGVESGCTAVVAFLHGRDLYVANAGDSRCIVSRAGEALDMSLDHKPEDDIEIERIVAAGGFVSCDGRVNGGLNLSRAIGDHAYKQTENLPPEEQMITALPDVRTLTLDPEKDEFMVLACDGIWNSMTSQDVVSFVRARIQSGDKKLSTICEELFDFCLAPNTASDGTGCDNMTAVIVQFLPVLGEANSSDLPNTSISTATNKRPASPTTENTDSLVKRFKTGVV